MWEWKKIQKMPFTTRIDELKQEFNRFLFQLIVYFQAVGECEL